MRASNHLAASAELELKEQSREKKHAALNAQPTVR